LIIPADTVMFMEMPNYDILKSILCGAFMLSLEQDNAPYRLIVSSPLHNPSCTPSNTIRTFQWHCLGVWFCHHRHPQAESTWLQSVIPMGFWL